MHLVSFWFCSVVKCVHNHVHKKITTVSFAGNHIGFNCSQYKLMRGRPLSLLRMQVASWLSINPPQFCLKVVYKRGGVFLGAYGPPYIVHATCCIEFVIVNCVNNSRNIPSLKLSANFCHVLLIICMHIVGTWVSNVVAYLNTKSFRLTCIKQVCAKLNYQP